MANLMESGSDRETIERVLGGEVNAFELLIEKYKNHVFSIVMNHVPPSRGEEVAQAVFVKAFRHLSSFRADSPFPHWLARIAVRCCYDFWKGAKRVREIPISSLTDRHTEWMERTRHAESREAFDRQADREEALEVLEWALEQLSPPNRMVLTLLHREGRSVKEVSVLMGWSEAKVKVQAHRCRHQMREIIEKMPQPPRGER